MHKYLILFVLLLSSAAFGQWSSDPQNHVRYQCGDCNMVERYSICSDSLGGVFFATAFSYCSSSFWIFHLNADGYPTLQGTECPNSIRVDSAQYQAGYRFGWEIRLIPSEPPGTVIVLCGRFLRDSDTNPTYLGMTIVKFDTLGLTGFGRVFIPADTDLFFGVRGYEGLWDYQGQYEGASDLQGGVHLIITNWTTSSRYYNHLSAEGNLTYLFPGVPLRGNYLHADGVGGVFDLWGTSPTNPTEIYAQRYNASGDSVFEAGGRLIPGINQWPLAFNLSPNRILCRTQETTAGGLQDQYLFLLDTNATNLWEPQGRLFRSGDSAVRAIIPDKTGGFFYFDRGSQDTLSTMRRYDSDAQLIASSTPGRHVLWRADGLGGGYFYEMQAKVWRWQPDLTPAWPDCLIVFECDNCGSIKYTAVEGGGLVGVIGTSTGFAFYHVNPNGTLGPRTDVLPPVSPLPKQFSFATYPNPFNGTTQIEYALPSTQKISLQLYDVLGREVAVLMNETQTAGEHRVTFDAAGLASGVYLCRLEAETFTQTKKMVLIR